MVKDQIDAIMFVVERDAVLTTDERKSFAKFQQEWLQMVAQQRLQIRFRDRVWFRDRQKFKDVGFAKQIVGFGNELPARPVSELPLCPFRLPTAGTEKISSGGPVPEPSIFHGSSGVGKSCVRVHRRSSGVRQNCIGRPYNT